MQESVPHSHTTPPHTHLARVFFTVANRLFSWLFFFFGLVEERGHSTVVPTESGHSYPAHHRDTQIATRGSDIRVIQAQSSLVEVNQAI